MSFGVAYAGVSAEMSVLRTGTSVPALRPGSPTCESHHLQVGDKDIFCRPSLIQGSVLGYVVTEAEGEQERTPKELPACFIQVKYLRFELLIHAKLFPRPQRYGTDIDTLRLLFKLHPATLMSVVVLGRRTGGVFHHLYHGRRKIDSQLPHLMKNLGKLAVCARRIVYLGTSGLRFCYSRCRSRTLQSEYLC